MQESIHKSFGFLKTTAVGGLIFLLPLIVIGALIGQVVPIVMSVAEFLGEWIPVRTVEGIGLLIALAIALIVFACFFAGLAARRSIGKQFSRLVEKYLLMLFPRYAILRDQMAGSIGGDHEKPRLKPVLVRFDDASRVAFEVERADTGQVTIFLPGSPDPWSGHVVTVTADRVESLQIEFADAVATFEQLGRGSAQAITNTAANQPDGDDAAEAEIANSEPQQK